MAVRNEDGTFKPGVIYVLVSGDLDTENFDLFYCGESENPFRREIEHRTAGMNSTKDSTDVYRHIADLHRQKIPWSLHIVQEYGTEGPEAAEDEVLCKLIQSGCKLMNMKHGNQFWEDVISTMSSLGIASYSEYLLYKSREKEAENALKVQISTTFLPLTKDQLRDSAAKRKAARECGLLPSRGRKSKK
jgi:hypothetical protein